jgi:hypothetical protein
MDSICNYSANFAYPHCKKRLSVFPSPAGMSLTKLSLGMEKTAYLFLQCILPNVSVHHFLTFFAMRSPARFTLQRHYTENSKTNIPGNETARPRSQFLHSCFGERFLQYNPTIGLPILLLENRFFSPS